MKYLKISFLFRRNYTTRTIAVSGVIFDSKKKPNNILFIKRENSPFKGLLCFPGGKVEKGENYIDATIREIKEETDLDVEFNDYHLFKITDMKDYLIITSVGFLKEGSLVNLREDSFESKWMSKEEINSLNEEIFVPNIKKLSCDAFEIVMKYI